LVILLITQYTGPPECSICHQLLSVKHTLTECTYDNLSRWQYYSHTNVKDIFNLSSNKNITHFMKNISLYDKFLNMDVLDTTFLKIPYSKLIFVEYNFTQFVIALKARHDLDCVEHANRRQNTNTVA